ncbi:MAG TPA: anthranilate synthase component I [Methylophaga aminisulfidivorans]|uniref:Anthranilate synthase component 1 n=1 Tax=Methylophaga aminisulfidivorans MP TaxID=1026882 RepID=F5SUC8_9GAMM|nr:MULTISPECIES: anthranilate synthase component I [Methylophaga]EGL55509.1 anthranilate/para-aminobenzoate synthase component I [Methylophaga aminisulfidivorans MP]WVI86610.1 anthranilate synthase component I [Methylophaga thalassica]HIC46835.1 anthranilate synthase component I [Methylophaga sp.]HIM40375.1 anthranilate synthase component I [Methylophaga aminisulfidivorans]
MKQSEFDQLATEGYNRIPLSREVLADLDTPLSAYLKLADAPYSYLFESVQGGEKWGRYSMIGLPCRTIVRVRDKDIVVEQDGQVIETAQANDPLAWIEQFQTRYRVAETDSLPKFNGGLVGYFGYDTVRYVESRLNKAPESDPLECPDILLMVSDELVVFDNLSGRLYLIVHADPNTENAYRIAQQRLDELTQTLRQTAMNFQQNKVHKQVNEEDFQSGFTQQGFTDAVEKAKQYINDGDIMQVVLSQRLTIPYSAPPIDLYRALRTLNPSPYMFYMHLDDFYVVGSSPEILVRMEDQEVTVRPIAGTRPRGKNEEEDIALEQDLLSDPKELAEHLMLIDLGRNDVGRVSKTGTVELTDKMVIERYSHVMHIVSNVTGQVLDDMSAIDALRATFPAGTVSGAPKVRAMEIIDELEPVKRGVYAGAVGYLSWSGNMDTAIAIRTAVIKNDLLHIQAGAGIVYDSVPEMEWKETMNKARAIFRAVAMAEAGLEANPHAES